MKYMVFWLPPAEAELMRLWVAGPDRAAITAASDRIDLLLSRNPELRGEARDEGVRILVCLPLAVLFRVYADDLKVEVGAVWRWQRQTP